MSRLTEREPHWLGEEFWVSAQEPDEEELDKVYMKLKHYEDLEEQGRLIEIVRCRDCEHYNADGCSEGCGWCEKLNIGSFDDAYCDKASLAELKGTEDEI